MKKSVWVLYKNSFDKKLLQAVVIKNKKLVHRITKDIPPTKMKNMACGKCSNKKLCNERFE